MVSMFQRAYVSTTIFVHESRVVTKFCRLFMKFRRNAVSQNFDTQPLLSNSSISYANTKNYNFRVYIHTYVIVQLHSVPLKLTNR
jgi:hypothetical protein